MPILEWVSLKVVVLDQFGKIVDKKHAKYPKLAICALGKAMVKAKWLTETSYLRKIKTSYGRRA